MDYAFTLSGRSSELSSSIYPPLQLDGTYEIALLNFETFNSIPNITEANNKFPFYDGGTRHVITIPTGTYELDDLHTYIERQLPLELNRTRMGSADRFFMRANLNTMKTELCSPFDVDFSEQGTIAPLLGFSNKRLGANAVHVSEDVVNIFGVSIIRVECNLATGSFMNGRPTHAIYDFFPSVPPGYHITQAPSAPIYLPLIPTKHIADLTVRIVDQNGDLVPFQGEIITIRLHIRRHGTPVS